MPYASPPPPRKRAVGPAKPLGQAAGGALPPGASSPLERRAVAKGGGLARGKGVKDRNQSARKDARSNGEADAQAPHVPKLALADDAQDGGRENVGEEGVSSARVNSSEGSVSHRDRRNSALGHPAGRKGKLGSERVGRARESAPLPAASPLYQEVKMDDSGGLVSESDSMSAKKGLQDKGDAATQAERQKRLDAIQRRKGDGDGAELGRELKEQNDWKFGYGRRAVNEGGEGKEDGEVEDEREGGYERTLQKGRESDRGLVAEEEGDMEDQYDYDDDFDDVDDSGKSCTVPMLTGALIYLFTRVQLPPFECF